MNYPISDMLANTEYGNRFERALRNGSLKTTENTKGKLSRVFIIEYDGIKQVVKYTKDRNKSTQLEQFLYQSLKEKGVLTPKTIAYQEIDNSSISICSFIEGNDYTNKVLDEYGTKTLFDELSSITNIITQLGETSNELSQYMFNKKEFAESVFGVFKSIINLEIANSAYQAIKKDFPSIKNSVFSDRSILNLIETEKGIAHIDFNFVHNSPLYSEHIHFFDDPRIKHATIEEMKTEEYLIASTLMNLKQTPIMIDIYGKDHGLSLLNNSEISAQKLGVSNTLNVINQIKKFYNS